MPPIASSPITLSLVHLDFLNFEVCVGYCIVWGNENQYRASSDINTSQLWLKVCLPLRSIWYKYLFSFGLFGLSVTQLAFITRSLEALGASIRAWASSIFFTRLKQMMHEFLPGLLCDFLCSFVCIFLKLKETAKLPCFRWPTLFYRSVDNLENADVLSDFPLNATDPGN